MNKCKQETNDDKIIYPGFCVDVLKTSPTGNQWGLMTCNRRGPL